jgi:predicted nuclease with TOPRIM domain
MRGGFEMVNAQAKRFVMKAGIAAGAAVLMGVFLHAGQAAPAPKNEDVLPALLAEVRGLRAAMEQMASAGPRIQLFVSRLQLQEGRMNAMIRRLESVRENLASEQRELENAQEAVKRFETALVTATGPAREELTQVLPGRRREIAEHRATVGRLTAEESQLAADLATEQGRWTDINQRLDELERALSKR